MMQSVKLNQVCKILNGYAFKSEEYQSEGVPLLRISNFDGGEVVVDDKSIYVDQSFLKTKTDFIVEKGDILIALSGATTGKYGIYNYDFPTLLNQRIGLIKSSASSKLLGKYFYHFLNILKDEILRKAGGAAQPNISTKTIGELEIPLPPLPQQQKIANILDAADALRQNDKALIAKYDELTQALFLDMFGDVRKNEKGWKQIALEKICDVGSSRRVFVDELVEEGVPFYRGTEIGQMSINENINPSLFITSVHYENLKKETGVPEIGDLLMPSICPDGRIFEVTNDNPFYFKDGRVLWIKVNKSNINSVYLKKHLKAIFAVDYSKIASGTTFAELKIFALKKLILHYPPIELQNQFADRVAVIEKQKAIAQKSLEKSENLFNSLLQKAFKGELV